MTEVVSLALAHLRISLLALAIGTTIALPVGLFAARHPRFERAALAFASVVQTIPGLALLAVMVPTLAALGAWLHVRVPSIGELPAVLALSVYAVLPILRGVVLGIGGVEPAMREAAEAVGMTSRQRLRLVEIPLALPHIVGGLRTATVWTVGMATLATPVGGRSLGELIFGGLQTRHHDQVLLGCLAAAVLAIALDVLVRTAEVGARTRRRALRDPSLGALGAMALWAVVSSGLDVAHAGDRKARVGAKSFTEQRILGEVLGGTLEASGTAADTVPSLGTTVAFDALAGGELDVYVEYTGTVWTTLMGHADVPADRTTLRTEVEAWLRTEKHVTVAASLGFENTYALVVRDATPARKISELGAADGLVLGNDYEFLSRPEWAALQSHYGLRFRDRRPMDPSLLYEAVSTGALDVAVGFSSDARIEALGLRVLQDDQGAIPPYDAVILVREAFAREHPEAFAALKKLDGTIDVGAMRAMNLAVDRDAKSPHDVAAEFLKKRGGR